MPKKRTKQQKARVTYHYAYPAGRSFTGLESGELKQVVEETNIERLYQYDPSFTRQDLKKTFIITIFMIAAELGLYFFSFK